MFKFTFLFALTEMLTITLIIEQTVEGVIIYRLPPMLELEEMTTPAYNLTFLPNTIGASRMDIMNRLQEAQVKHANNPTTGNTAIAIAIGGEYRD